MKRTGLILSAIAVAAMGIAHAGNYGDKSTANKTITDVAESNQHFTMLTNALEATGLNKTLANQGPYTVFAPTDAAFKKLPKDQLEQLLKDEATLTRILTYHVVADELVATEVMEMDSATTVGGSQIKIKSRGSSVTVDDARVVMTDVKASNGVIHAIDTVLLPPDIQGEIHRRPSTPR